MRIFRDAQHSRLPVYRDTLDNPIGMVHIKELIGLAVPEAEGAPHPKTIQDIRRDVLFVPPSMPVVDLLVKMQATRIHLALVIDEYGGTDGLVSIEDLVEQIVGDIEDEHDTDEAKLIARARTASSTPARAPISKRSKRRSGSRWSTRKRRKRSTRWRGSCFRSSGACRSAGKSSSIRPASSSKCWMPIRAGSSGCACA